MKAAASGITAAKKVASKKENTESGTDPGATIESILASVIC
jgi:hypothetical protein